MKSVHKNNQKVMSRNFNSW